MSEGLTEEDFERAEAIRDGLREDGVVVKSYLPEGE